MTTTTAPRLYVGTYAKYSNGSIKGAWIDLEGHDAGSFLEACRALHADESDSEFMFQDYEGFPKGLYAESYIHSLLWDWLGCSEEEREIWEAYAEAIGLPFEDTELACALDAYAGQYDSEEHFAESICEETENLNALPGWLSACIDWRAVWQSALRFDYCNHGGFFFRNK